MPAPDRDIPLPPEPERDPWDDPTPAPVSGPARPRRPRAAPTPPAPAAAPEAEPADDEWPVPAPLVRYPDPLPTDALGGTLGPMVDAVAHTFQVPPDIAVTMALPLITTAAAGRWVIHANHNGWRENFALATVSILESSGGKSPTLTKLAAPLIEYEAEAADAARDTYARDKALQEELKDRVEKYRVELKNTPPHKLLPGSTQLADYLQDQQRYLDAAAALEAHEIRMPPRWMVDDITPEALAKVMSEQDGAIGIVSAESGIFGTLGGRYASGQSNLDVALKGVSGDRISIDRKGNNGPPVIITHPVLSISVAIQPGLWRRLGEKPDFRESGLLGRFLYVMPESKMGYRLIGADGVPEEVENLYAGCLEELAKTAQGLRERGERRDLWLDAESIALVEEFRRDLEPQFREGEELEQFKDVGGKLAGNAVRIAAALTLLENADAEIVDAATTRNALRLAAGFVDHARAALGSMGGQDPSTPHARVVAWLGKQGKDAVGHREIHQVFKHKPWARLSKEMDDVMSDLEHAGYVRRGHRSAEGEKGGRPAVVWVVNPQVLNTSASWSQKASQAGQRTAGDAA